MKGHSNYKSDPLNNNSRNTRFKHKFSEKEYSETKESLFDSIEEIDTKITQRFNPVKRRIIQMAIKNIHDTAELYFNLDTSRPSARQDSIFKNSTHELVSIARFLPPSEDKNETINWLQITLNEIQEKIATQHAYLEEIEVKLYEKNKNMQEPQLPW